MPVSVGGKKPGPSPDQLLDWIASIWVEAIETGKELRRLEARIARQQDWLDHNRDDPRYVERTHQARIAIKEFDYHQLTLHKLANRANEVTALMDAQTKAQAQELVHAWVTMGSPGIYAIAWDLIPDPAWLDEADER